VHLGPHRCCYTNYVHLLWDTIRVWEPLTNGFYIENLIRGKENVFLPLHLTTLNSFMPLINQHHSLREKRIKALTEFICTLKTGCPTVTQQREVTSVIYHPFLITILVMGYLINMHTKNRSSYLISHNSLGKENYHHSFMSFTYWNVWQKYLAFSENVWSWKWG